MSRGRLDTSILTTKQARLLAPQFKDVDRDMSGSVCHRLRRPVYQRPIFLLFECILLEWRNFVKKKWECVIRPRGECTM